MKNYCCHFKEEHKNRSEELKNYFQNIKLDLSSEEILNILNKIVKKSKIEEINTYSTENLKYSTFENDDFVYCLDTVFPCYSCFKHYTGKTWTEQLKFEKSRKKILQDKKDEFNDKDVKFYSIQELITETKKEVIGQDELVKKMATILYMHQLKVLGKIESNKNIIPLITGATGTGKTLIIETMSKLINVPFISLSMDTFTADGWSGNDLLDHLDKYKNENNFENCIIYIDEFDKIHYGDSQRQSESKSKQNRLLTFLQGENIDISDKKKANSANMQIVLSGAYRDFVVNNGIGFQGDINKSKKINLSLTKDDIVKLGLLPELMGRITQIYNTRDLEIEDYKNILNNSSTGYLKYYGDILENVGLKINYTDVFINKIAAKALNSNFGARDLNNYLFDYFQPIILEFSSIENNKNISFDLTDNVDSDILNIQKELKKTEKKKKTKKQAKK